MEAEEHGTLLLRVLKRAARAVVRIRCVTSSSSPAAAASPGCSSQLPRTPSLLDCMDDDGVFYSAASSPVVEVVHYSRSMTQLPRSPSSPGADIDRRAAEFIERFRRNKSLELRYCGVPSPLTPVKPPMSPDTYFKLSRMQHGGSPAPAAYGRKSSLGSRRRSGMSIKWPTATAGRPTVRV